MTAGLVATGLLGTGAAQAAPAEGTVRDAGVAGAIPDSYIVVFKDGSAESRTVDAAAGKLTRAYGGTVRHAYTRAVNGFSARLTATAARRLAANPAVAYVEADRQVHATGTQTNPPSWGLDRIDQAGLPLSGAYTYPTAAANVTAYIIDTGIRITHTDFGGRARYGYDFIDNDAVPDDCAGHGTHVAGTVGGSTYGVAKAVQLVAVRVLDCSGSGSYSQIIAGVDWVTKNAVKPAVANMSLGGAAGSTLDNAVKKSIASGVTYAVAAGNDNADACTKSPARLPEAITVAATDASDARASFSNYGTCVDLFAPGVNITSAYKTSDTATARMNGTSMATPHVAGVAALYLSANPTASPAQVRDALVTATVGGRVTNPAAGSPNKLLNLTVTATVTNPAPTPTPTPTPTPAPTQPSSGIPAVVSLRARANDRFVCAESGGGSWLVANRAAAGLWETYDTVDTGDGYIALRARANGRYVVAESGGGAPLIANRTAIGLWEKFRLIRNADGTVSLLAAANGRYVTAESAGGAPLIANRTTIGLWESFTLA
ncbi:S8 family serine peptidase [Planosporangium mesophilum]|uniref:S8 family serine peptidase n=1 Tax=Planosporangium mesophilum TaxID=689768 RepID=UPI00357175BE